jgi:hypothetical protein
MTPRAQKWPLPGLRGIHILHSAEEADTLRSVTQVVALVVYPVCCLFVTQVLLQLVLYSSVSTITDRGKRLYVQATMSYKEGDCRSKSGPSFLLSPSLLLHTTKSTMLWRWSCM